MADMDMCSSCFSETKYTCLVCCLPFCNKCTVFENNEDTPGWSMGSSVGYCLQCHEEKKNRETITIQAQESKRKQTETETDDGHKRQRTEPEDILPTETNEELEEEEEDYHEADKRRKKPGRKSHWSSAATNDLIDIVVSNDQYKRKLIFINTKNQKNGEIYKDILQELKQRASLRGETLTFTIDQLRTKFKRCVAECKKAALTIKTATGIRRLQHEKEFGQWFTQLFPVVRTRDSCQPEQAVEPSFTQGTDRKDDQDTSGELFVPVRSGYKKRKKNKKNSIESTTLEVLNLVKTFVENDPTKELVGFMREEMEKSRQQEMQLFHLMLNTNSNNDCYQQSSSIYHAPQQGDMPFGSGPSMAQGFQNTWHGGFSSAMPNESRVAGFPLRSSSPLLGLPPHSRLSNPSPSPISGEHASTYHIM